MTWELAAAGFEINQGKNVKALNRIETATTISRDLIGSPALFPLLFGIICAAKVDRAVLRAAPQVSAGELAKLTEWRRSYPDPVDTFIGSMQHECYDTTSMLKIGPPRIIGADGKDQGSKIGYAFLKWIRWPKRESAVFAAATMRQIENIKAWDASGRKGDPVFIDPDVDLQNSILARIAWADTGKYFAKIKQHLKRTDAMMKTLEILASAQDTQAAQRREIEYDDENLIVVENGKARMEKKEKGGEKPAVLKGKQQ